MLKWLQDKSADLAAGVYDGCAGLAGKLSGHLALPRLSNWLGRTFSKRPALLGIELFVALSLTVNFYWLVRPTCLPYRDGNTISRSVFACLSKYANPAGKEQMQLNWQKRLAGPVLSAWLIDAKFKGQVDLIGNRFQNIFGFYHATWLFLFFLMLIYFRPDALWIMLAVFGGLMYNLTDPSGPAFYYPWDIPTMLFFTLACLLYDGRRMGPLVAAVWLGGLFKETTLCCALLILLGEHWTWKKRLAGFAATVLATLATNKLLMLAHGLRAPVLAMNDASRWSDLVRHTVLPNNLAALFHPDLRHVLFVNAGSLFIILLLPWRNRRDVVFKLLMVAYIVGEFFYGIINEFRIWYEILPLGWMLIADTLSKANRPAPEPTSAEVRSEHALKAGYWLMMGALALAAAGAFIGVRTGSPRLTVASQPGQLNIPELLSAASKGDAEAQYRLGQAYQAGNGVQPDTFEAADWYQRAAEKGHSQAQCSLGNLLAAAKDYTAAAPWFARSAAQGNAEAQYSLGIFYRNGLAGRPDYELAVQMFQKSAQQGHVLAQFDLGKMYETGRGVKPDCLEAYKWLKLAALQGNAKAEDELKICAASMTADQVAAANKLVQEFQTPGK